MALLGSQNEIIIGAHNRHEYAMVDQFVNGQRQSRGLIPRNYTTHPVGYYARERALEMPVISRSEWPERIRDMTAQKSRLSDIRDKGNNGQRIPSTDQDGVGYCWCHSGTSAMLLIRAAMNVVYADLSAFSVGCPIKNYQDQGGWGAQGLDFMIQNGIATSEFWPQKSMSRSNDTPAMRENRKMHRFTDAWMESARPQYDRTMTFDQVMTCLLLCIPVICDFNWWGHSVCGTDPVDGNAQWGLTRMDNGKLPDFRQFVKIWGIDEVTAGFSQRIWNSWTDSWGTAGMGVLTGTQAIPDGATAPKVATPTLWTPHGFRR